MQSTHKPRLRPANNNIYLNADFRHPGLAIMQCPKSGQWRPAVLLTWLRSKSYRKKLQKAFINALSGGQQGKVWGGEREMYTLTRLLLKRASTSLRHHSMLLGLTSGYAVMASCSWFTLPTGSGEEERISCRTRLNKIVCQEPIHAFIHSYLPSLAQGSGTCSPEQLPV